MAPWPIRHRGRYLRMMGFFSIILLTFACGRLTGLLMGMSATDYYTLANIVLAGLMAVEGLRIGWRQYLLAVPSLVYVPILNLFPHLRVVMYNLLLFGLVIASIYLHMRQPAPPVNSVNQPGD